MGKFKVTPQQRDLLLKIAKHSLETGNQSYTYDVLDIHEGGRLEGLDIETEPLTYLTQSIAVFRALERLGYLGVEEVPLMETYIDTSGLHPFTRTRDSTRRETHITLTQDLFDFHKYMQRSKWRQRLQDFGYDLGQDTTLRSKLIWAIGTAILAITANIGLTFLLNALGWI